MRRNELHAMILGACIGFIITSILVLMGQVSEPRWEYVLAIVTNSVAALVNLYFMKQARS